MAYNNYGGYGYSNVYPYGNYYQPNMPQQQPNYNNVGNNMMQNQNQQVQQPQMNQQPQMQQTSYLPLTFTSGVVGVKSFIVPPNQTIFLRDSDEGSDLLFQKSADPYGKYTIKAYHMVEVNLEDIGKPIQEMKKEITPDIATKQDLIDLKSLFESKIGELSSLIQKSYKTPKNNGYIKDGDKNE